MAAPMKEIVHVTMSSVLRAWNVSEAKAWEVSAGEGSTYNNGTKDCLH